MSSITVLIEAHNEERNIQSCIESALLLTNHITVIDMESTDATSTLAKQKGAQVYAFAPHPQYVEPARAFGINLIDTEWIMILDPDERLTQELCTEITQAITNSTYTSYKIPRKNIFGKKKWLSHGGWWPDHQTRLIKKSAFRDWPTAIHSTPLIDGKQGILSTPFLHYFHGDLTQMVHKTILFEHIESDLLFQAKKSVSLFTLFRKFFGELSRRLLFNQGFRDGIIGYIESIYQAFSKTITYLYLYEKKKSSAL